MANEDLGGDIVEKRFPVTPVRLSAIILLVLAILFLLYWAFLRVEYVPVFEGLSEADAAAVVAELEAQKLPYRLANDGATILVDRKQADAARLRIASSELPLRGQIGFELFNESDMGITEFAQKINYQRALQGELARTIMLLDGIDNARVHLAFPERTLFRGAQARPTAAVTLVLHPGHVITAARIAGIQRLVSGAVPELQVASVVITDDSGQLISADTPNAPPDPIVGESEAVRAYYQARVTTAITTVVPELETRVDVTVRQRTAITLDHSESNSGVAAQDVVEEAPSISTVPSDARARPANNVSGRNYALLVSITTDRQLSPETRERISQVVIAAAELGRDRTDQLSFNVGPISPLAATATQLEPRSSVVVSRQPFEPAAVRGWEPTWMIVAVSALSAAFLAGFAIFMLMRRRAVSRADPAEAFAAQLKARLAADGVGNG